MIMTPLFNISRGPAGYGACTERVEKEEGRLDRFVHSAAGKVVNRIGIPAGLARAARDIDSSGEMYSAMSRRQLDHEISRLREEMTRYGLAQELVVRAFAAIREMSGRVLDMRHFHSQLLGGLVLLQGSVAEMDTGEGKTLTAVLPAAAAALAGIPVHVITVNDYLAGRDASLMRPLYEALGVSLGCVLHGMNVSEKRAAYASDVVYVTNKELTFDYLRDVLAAGERLDPLLLKAEHLHAGAAGSRKNRLLLRGLHFAIVDEADSILIDEARTPLIISGEEGEDDEQQFLQEAMEVAGKLTEDTDYIVDIPHRKVILSSDGSRKVKKLSGGLGPLWRGRVRRESTVIQALTALYLYHLDEQYLLRDGKVCIIDEFTGRIMADRSWEKGLHQLIELKEGMELSKRRKTLARISYQRFFRRYLHLSGMTGTAREITGELWHVYGLTVKKVPTNRPVIRRSLPSRIYPGRERKLVEIVRRIEEIHQEGRPVLVGTRSVAVSEQLAAAVAVKGLPHLVLNARQDAKEAEIVAEAGVEGAITIATNMAGRGTDILLGRGVRERGGLHVILTERHEAARIDRQLAGRCGRQGDPGSYEAILSLEDGIVAESGDGWLVKMVGCLLGIPFLGHVIGRLAMNRMQRRLESYHGRVRRELFRQDREQGSLLSFTGRIE